MSDTMALMTVSELAQRMDVSTSLIYRLVETGEIACLRIGRAAIRFTEEHLGEHLGEYLERCLEPAGAREREPASSMTGPAALPRLRPSGRPGA